VPALSRRDLGFLAWNAAIGLVAGVLVARWPELQSGPIPPLFWLLLGMAFFEMISSFALGGQARLSNPIRIVGLAIASGIYLAASAALGSA
jgi:hypothetical protein